LIHKHAQSTGKWQKNQSTEWSKKPETKGMAENEQVELINDYFKGKYWNEGVGKDTILIYQAIQSCVPKK